MNSDWNEYLQSTAPQETHDAATDNQMADTSDIICNLSQFGLIVIAGDDAAAFMQGQFTNDVDLIDENTSQLNGFCNKKGRMIANFKVFKYQGNYFLSVKNDLIEKSIQHLQNYVLRSHVGIQDVTEQLIHIGVSGDNAVSQLSEFIKDINTELDSLSYNDDFIAMCVAGEKPRYEVFCSLEHAKTLWDKISQQNTVVDSSAWDYLNIQAGLPLIDASTSGEFVPQMTNMELINGVSFTKGCFTGQEIIARMHYLGKLKKRCYKINIETDNKPNNGDKLFAENARAGQNTGAIIQVEKNPDSGYDALAVIQIADTDAQLFLNDADGPKITLKELPYSFEAK